MEQIATFEIDGSPASALDYDLNGLTVEDLERAFGISITQFRDKDSGLGKGFGALKEHKSYILYGKGTLTQFLSSCLVPFVSVVVQYPFICAHCTFCLVLQSQISLK